MNAKILKFLGAVLLLLLVQPLLQEDPAYGSKVRLLCAKAKDKLGCEKYVESLSRPKLIDSELNEDTIIASLKSIGVPDEIQFHKSFVELHLDLLHVFWRKQYVDLPNADLRLDDGFLKGCRKLRVSEVPNIYCHESSEITLNVDSLISMLPDKSYLNINTLSVIVLAHEFGHHVNFFSGRPPEELNEESAADIRAGKYLAYILSEGLIDIEDFLLAAQMFFQIGDFHMNIGYALHENPKKRFDSLVNGFNKISKIGSEYDGWMQDTKEAFSRPMKSGQSLANADSEYEFDVYRFEIERAGQVIGNAFRALAGVAICANGSGQSCANTILFQQGKAKPNGWYRRRKLILSCSTGVFDIEGDGIKAQLVELDQKGQAQILRSRYCSM